MLAMNATEIASCMSGTVYFDRNHAIAQGVAIDSRQVKENDVFFALLGEHMDGHDFLDSAVEQGASILIVQRLREDINLCQIQVEDTFLALQDLARAYRNRFQIPFIAITGSSGKTTTKDIIATVLSEKYNVLKTKGNLNSTTGVPLTIFDCMPYHEIGVIEMSMSYPNEILGNVDIVRPDTSVITNIGLCHIEFLGTQENIFRAKSEVLTYLTKDGTAILNYDDPFLRTIKEREFEIVGVGLEYGDLKALDIIHDSEQVTFSVMIGGNPQTFHFPIPGNHNVINALCAVATGLKYGLTVEDIQNGFVKFAPSAHRMEIVDELEITYINDTYNANPDAMRAAIDVLCYLSKGNRKIAVLCDMYELGHASENAHYRCGQYAAQQDIEILLTSGKYAESYAQGFYENQTMGVCVIMNSLEEIADYLIRNLTASDTVLFKASRGVHLEKVFQAVKEKRNNE